MPKPAELTEYTFLLGEVLAMFSSMKDPRAQQALTLLIARADGEVWQTWFAALHG